MKYLSSLSILITCHNKYSFLDSFEKNLEGLMELGPELIIVDDFSTDGSRELLKGLAKKTAGINLILNDRNLGSAESRNLALYVATREFVFFWDIDDFVVLDELKIMLEEAKAFSADLCKGNYAAASTILNSGNEVAPSRISQKTIRDQAISIVNDMGYWRYLYRREFLHDQDVRFLPTFNDLHLQKFILDDVFFIIQVASLNGVFISMGNRPPVYIYSTTRHNRDSWRHFQKQASLFPKSSLICYSHMKGQPQFSMDIASSALFLKCSTHMSFLLFSDWIKAVPDFLKLIRTIKMPSQNKILLSSLFVTLWKSIKNSISSHIQRIFS